MPLQQTSGNVTQDAYGGGKAVVPTYVENVFSTYLYTGTQATKTITNNIDLADNGGLVWFKDRTAARSHALFDTVRGVTSYLRSNTTDAAGSSSNALTSFNNNGFTLGNDSDGVNTNYPSGDNFVSWTFRKAPKFFDIVTYTGNGAGSNLISHNLGVQPGCIIFKVTSAAGYSWSTVHRGTNGYLNLNLTDAAAATYAAGIGNIGSGALVPCSATQIDVGPLVNDNGKTFVAYLFAHNARGFGLTGTQDIISCGSYTGNGSTSGPVINLGWEPQWILVKDTSSASNWYIQDTMRGMSQTNTLQLSPNTSGAEISHGAALFVPTATGFYLADSGGLNSSGENYIYIAIRRGPMATPTTGTSVFSPVYCSNEGVSTFTGTTNFPVDLQINNFIQGGENYAIDRLRGSSGTATVQLQTYLTHAEGSFSGYGIALDSNTSFTDTGVLTNSTGYQGIYWNFARAPGFFDIVCYTGTGSATTITHNLGVVPQLIIIKDRSLSTNWPCYNATLGATNYVFLNSNSAYGTTINFWNNTTPTSTVFSLGSGNANVNGSGDNYVAYLFATVTGVSYVGSYTGNGTGQSIACGFGASGARFILIKRTDSTGNWYCWDSANGLTSSSSPYLLWNSTAAQTTGNNGVYASSGGFTLGSTASTTTNISSASYIFLAVS